MARNRPRPFLDTNVFFSGLYSARGAPAALLDLHARGRIIVVVSQQVLSELVGVIREVRPDLLPALRTFLEAAPPEVTPDPTKEEVAEAAACINAVDAFILAAAKASHADCLVTGNTRHFTASVARCAGVTILTPRVYLDSLQVES